jgi:hypothetical protein
MSITTDVTVAIHRGEGARTASLQRWFPSLRVDYADHDSRDVTIADWLRDDFDFWAFDRSLDERTGEQFSIIVGGDPQGLPAATLQIVTRCQRLLFERNADSAGERFERVLHAHHALHDLSQPLVRADYDHSLDVWQWLLRLEPAAPFALQVAALFHDIERLDTEAFARIEQHAADYQEFKNAHAAAGAERTRALLASLGIDEADEIAQLVRKHEERPRDGDPWCQTETETGTRAKSSRNLYPGLGFGLTPSPVPSEETAFSDAEALQLINDADALSFFSLNSPGFFDYFSREHALRKVDYTLRRLSPKRHALLQTIRLRGDVAEAIQQCLQGMTA